MAKYKVSLSGNFDSIYNKIKKGILEGSLSASLEDEEIIRSEHMNIGILVFERYSYSGGNRLSLNVTIIEQNHSIQIIGISSGGSNGLFMKFNTLGEEAFLDKLKELISYL